MPTKTTLQNCLCALAVSLAAAGAHAGAIHDADLFTANSLPRNDDGSSPAASLGFQALINGTLYSSAYVNNNGNITFGSSLSTYTPSSILGNSFPIIAAFWADVDTRAAASGITQYGTGSIDGHNVFGVDWINVGYYNVESNLLNSFQMILTDRSDTGVGNFDIQFNYDKILWETGDVSGGTNGLGGTSAAVGYTVGPNSATQLAGSFVNGALLDGGVDSLTGHSLNSSVLGQYDFQVRGGVITNVPEPETYALLLAGLGLVGGLAKRRGQRA